MKTRETLVLHDEKYDKVCFVNRDIDKLNIFTKNITFRKYIEKFINGPIYKKVGGSDGEVQWDGIEQIEVDDQGYMSYLYETILNNLITNNSNDLIYISFLDDIKREYINHLIEKVWLTMIPKDYDNKFLLYEDSLKGSLYYHIRKELSELMEFTNIRIYPEYQTYRKEKVRKKIDLAIVEVTEFPEVGHLGNAEIEILSAIEIKYVGGRKGDDNAIFSDVEKCSNYLSELNGNPQIYLTVIQEAIYGTNDYSFLQEKNVNSDKRITELLAYIPLINKENEKMEFKVVKKDDCIIS